MMEAGLSTPAEFVDCNLYATKIVELMITRFKEAEHKNPAMIEAYRFLCLPVLSDLMDDPRMMAVLNPKIARKQLDELATITARLDQLNNLSRNEWEKLANDFEIENPADLSDAKLLELLTLKAKEHRGLKAALAELKDKLPQLDNVISDAMAQLELGDTNAVRAIIADARITLRDSTLQKSLEQDADLVEVDARALILMGDVQQASDILNAAADSFASIDPLEPARRRARYYEPLYDHGLAFGGAGLGLAVDMLQVVLAVVTREADARLWAVTQNNLGNALLNIGKREIGSDNLSAAVNAYENALLEISQKAVPLLWAKAQNNLGSALQNLGEREARTDTLLRAVDAFHAALLELTQEAVPLVWAMT